MKQISVYDAIGMTLAHDLFRFIDVRPQNAGVSIDVHPQNAGVSIDVRPQHSGGFIDKESPQHSGVSIDKESERTPFRRGHIIESKDIPILLAMGKENLFVFENENEKQNENDSDEKKINKKIHEEDAARRLAALCRTSDISESAIREGKIEFFAEDDGLFRVDIERQKRINSIEGIIIATRNSLFPVVKGDKLAAVKVVPLEIDDKLLRRAETEAGTTPLFELLPYKLKTAGLVITGSEIKSGKIKDAFAPLIAEKLKPFGIQIISKTITADGAENVLKSIAEIKRAKPDIILCCGGMSVDADDNTPLAIIQSNANVVCYGAPILPGSMFMLAYYDDGTAILGVPGGALCKKDHGGILDIVLPRLASRIRMTKDDFVALGNGGLCLVCPKCHYPICPYGKGV